VLAADRDIRMGGGGPKALSRVGDHGPLLHYILTGLKQAAINDLIVVTGFKPAETEKFVSEAWDDPTFVFNARWASWGNFHSVRVALDQSPGMDVLVVDTNIVVVPDVFHRVAGAPGDLVLAAERRHRFEPDDVRLSLRVNRVRAIGKELKLAHSHAKFAGISLIRSPGARGFSDIATDLQWSARTQVNYEDIYGLMLDGLDARAVEVTPGEHAKVDSPDDIPAAAQVIERFAEGQETAAGQVQESPSSS
jgi:choline kinase